MPKSPQSPQSSQKAKNPSDLDTLKTLERCIQNNISFAFRLKDRTTTMQDRHSNVLYRKLIWEAQESAPLKATKILEDLISYFDERINEYNRIIASQDPNTPYAMYSLHSYEYYKDLAFQTIAQLR